MVQSKGCCSWLRCAGCCTCCKSSCCNRTNCALFIAWIWTAISFVGIITFLRSVDEDLQYSKVTVQNNNNTMEFATDNIVRIIPVRKVVVLLDLGFVCLLDFTADLLLITGIKTNKPALIAQWLSTSTVWLILLACGQILKFTPKSREEGPIIAIAIVILSLRVFWGFKIYSEFTRDKHTTPKKEAVDAHETHSTVNDIESQGPSTAAKY